MVVDKLHFTSPAIKKPVIRIDIETVNWERKGLLRICENIVILLFDRAIITPVGPKRLRNEDTVEL